MGEMLAQLDEVTHGAVQLNASRLIFGGQKAVQSLPVGLDRYETSAEIIGKPSGLCPVPGDVETTTFHDDREDACADAFDQWRPIRRPGESGHAVPLAIHGQIGRCRAADCHEAEKQEAHRHAVGDRHGRVGGHSASPSILFFVRLGWLDGEAASGGAHAGNEGCDFAGQPLRLG